MNRFFVLGALCLSGSAAATPRIHQAGRLESDSHSRGVGEALEFEVREGTGLDYSDGARIEILEPASEGHSRFRLWREARSTATVTTLEAIPGHLTLTRDPMTSSGLLRRAKETGDPLTVRAVEAAAEADRGNLQQTLRAVGEKVAKQLFSQAGLEMKSPLLVVERIGLPLGSDPSKPSWFDADRIRSITEKGGRFTVSFHDQDDHYPWRIWIAGKMSFGKEVESFSYDVTDELRAR